MVGISQTYWQTDAVLNSMCAVLNSMWIAGIVQHFCIKLSNLYMRLIASVLFVLQHLTAPYRISLANRIYSSIGALI